MQKAIWKEAAWTGIILVLILGALGCKNLFPDRTNRDREPAVIQSIGTSYRFEDIPLAPGMTLNQKESFIYEAKAIRTGVLIYEGRGEMERLSGFFKQQMPKYQWKLVSNFEIHSVMLTFIKEGWICIITILPQEGEAKRIEMRVGPIDIKILP